MHILLIHQAFVALDEPGGTRHYEMATYLVERGHQVTIIASPISYLTGQSQVGPSAPESKAPVDGVTILRAYTYQALHRSFVHRVISFMSFMLSSFVKGLRVRDVDLIWGTSPPIFQAITAWTLSRIKRRPFLFEVRDLWPAFAIQVGVLRNRLLIRGSEWLERFLYSQADRIVVNSPGFMEYVRSRGGGAVELVPNGADVDMFNPSSNGETFREKHGLADKFVALYAGAHGMSNDLDVLLDAAQRLSDKQGIAIVMVGDGKEKPALMERAEKLALTNVNFLPPVPKSGMREVLAAADVCIAILKPVPLYDTVYPNKVFDYMAAGRPVVLAIDGVIRKVVEEADAGVYTPPGNPIELANGIESLAENPEACHTMGENGRACVEASFNRVHLAAALAEIMETMTDR